MAPESKRKSITRSTRNRSQVGSRPQSSAPAVAHPKRKGKDIPPRGLMKVSAEKLKEIYRLMKRCRAFEERSIVELRKGMPGFLHSAIGQEAIPCGISVFLRDDDDILTTVKNGSSIPPWPKRASPERRSAACDPLRRSCISTFRPSPRTLSLISPPNTAS